MLELIEMINYYLDENEESDQKLQFARGLFMLMHIEQLKDTAWSHVAFQIASSINKLYDDSTKISTHPLMEFLVSMSTVQTMQLVTRMHQLITDEVVTEQLRLDFIEACVKMLDVLYRANQLKPAGLRMAEKEFHNQSIN